jgi:hypothetical protein
MSSRFLWAVTDQMTPMTRMKVKVDIGYAAFFCHLGRVNLHTLKAKAISTPHAVSISLSLYRSISPLAFRYFIDRTKGFAKSSGNIYL